jgi:transposase
MRTGISITVSPADRRRLLALVKDRNAPQKHVWRAGIVLLSAGGAGTNAIMRQTGKSKTCVWRWQERFATEGFEGLLRDKTRPSRIKPLGDDVATRIVALTLDDLPGETTHWTGALMAKASGVSVSSVQRIWRTHGQSWPRKFEQADKWSFCLIAAMIAANRRDHEQTTASEPHSGLQGEGGPCGHQGRDDVGTVG